MRIGFALPLLALVLLGTAASAAKPVDTRAERAAAVAAEQKGDFDAALLHYENIYDSTPTTAQERLELRRKFEELRPKVKPNTDPSKAGVWKIKLYIFRTVELDWTRDGKTAHVKNAYTDDNIRRIDEAMAGFAKEVWDHTLGSLQIKWDTVVIDKPLTKFPGWPDPADTIPYFTDLKAGDADCLFVFCNAEGLDPWDLWGGTIGIMPEAKGAVYIGFNDNNAGISEDPTGEVELHEWLHAAQMALESFQGYPEGLMVTSDCGGNCSGIPNVKCWDRKLDDKSPGWMSWYRHALDAHLTRRMWRELSITRPAQNPWIDRNCRKFLLLGPYSGAKEPHHGLDTEYITETGAAVDPSTWQVATATGRSLDIASYLSPSEDQVAYLAVNVWSRKAQEAQMRIGSDDGCKVWQDGKLVLREPRLRSAAADQNIVDIKLRKGNNLFLMKVVNATGGWEMIFRISDSKGNPLPSVDYRVPKRVASK